MPGGIEQALARHGVPEIIDTHQGGQFIAEVFAGAVLHRGCKLLMDGRGVWRYNVFVERLWRSLKHECVYLKAYRRRRRPGRHRPLHRLVQRVPEAFKPP